MKKKRSNGPIELRTNNNNSCMLDRITDIFVEIDDFCNNFQPQWEQYMISTGEFKRRGPACGLSYSEIMTIVILYHGSNFQHFKNFYQGVMIGLCSSLFPKLPSYQRFIELLPRIIVPITLFLSSKMGRKTGIYYIDSTPLPVCHNLRINKHRVFKGLASRGKSSTGWFFGFKLHLIFNNLNEIVAVKLTSGNHSDISALPALAKDLIGKMFGDKGYLGKKIADELLKQGLALMTKVRKNMKSLLMKVQDKFLLKARNIAETIIGHIKEFSSLNLPKHRSPVNAMIHIISALVSYQLNPIKPKIKLCLLPF